MTIKHVVNFFLLFFLIYDINFKFFPEYITTGRIVVFFLIVVDFKSIFSFLKHYDKYFIIVSYIFLFSLIRNLFSEDFTQTSRLFFFIVYCILGSYLISRRFATKKSFLNTILLAISIQGILLIYVFFNPILKNILEIYIIYGANFNTDNLYRSFGLTSSTGAALSVIQSLGVGVGLYAISKNFFKKRMLFLIFICFLSTIFVGRTGLLLSILFSVLFVLQKLSVLKVFTYITIIYIVFSIGLGSFFRDKLETIEDFSATYFIGWLNEGVNIGDNKTVKTLIYTQKIPELTLETFFIGTGTISKDGKNTSGHDSGYVQTYYSLGILMSIIFYVSFFIFIFKKFKNENKKFLFIIVILIMLLEFKEPFLFKYSEGIIILSLLWVNYFNQIGVLTPNIKPINIT